MAISVRTTAVTDDMVSVIYNDGHTLQLFANVGGPQMPVTIEKMVILKENKEVVIFFSEYQKPVNYVPFGFVMVGKGYTLDRIVTYWRLAREYIHNAPNSGSNLKAWRIVRMGDRDFDDIRSGKWLMQ